MILSPVKHKQTKTTHQQIQSLLKKVDVFRFPVVSNEATQELNSDAVNKQNQNTPSSKKTRLPSSVADASPAILKILKTNGAARTWQGPAEY